MTRRLILLAQAGAAKPLAVPERPATRIGVEDAEIEYTCSPRSGEGFGMCEKGFPVTRALRPGAEGHEAKVCVAWFREAEGQLGHAGEAAFQKETEAVA